MKSQQGIGLIEVLVALLLLAVAVLGFSAMQITAIKATDETILRSQALSLMRGGAEMMRANPDGITSFRDALNDTETSIPVDDDTITKDSCVTTGTTLKSCTVNQLAARDALALKAQASQSGVKVRADICPATTTGQPLTCLIAAWGNTEPSFGTAANDCMKETGDYNIGVSCFVMEAY